MPKPFSVQPASDFTPNTVGAWAGVPMDTYQASPGESNTLLGLLARSPLRYKMTREGLIDREETKDMQLGTMIHSATNEGHEPAYTLIPDTYPAKDGTDKPWNWNAAHCKDWRAKTPGPILYPQEALMLNHVTGAVKADKKAMRLLTRAHKEVSAFAYNSDLESPYLLRVRFDVLGHDEAGWYFADTKSTRNAETAAFGREIYKRFYHVQMALYARVLERLTGEVPRCFLIAIEKDAAIPRVNVRQLSPAAIEAGGKVLDDRLRLLKQCRIGNRWPALADDEGGDTIQMIDLPEYAYGSVDDLEGMTEIEPEKTEP